MQTQTTNVCRSATCSSLELLCCTLSVDEKGDKEKSTNQHTSQHWQGGMPSSRTKNLDDLGDEAPVQRFLLCFLRGRREAAGSLNDKKNFQQKETHSLEPDA